MVTGRLKNSCDDTDLVTNLDTKQKWPTEVSHCCYELPRIYWLREKDLNLRPLGYEPNELPDCSIAR